MFRLNLSATQTGIGHGRALTGLVGRGILRSRSPWLHEQEAGALGLALVYSLFDFDDRGWSDADLPALLDAVQRVGFSGVNVTFPFKQAVIPLLDELSQTAQRVGAVNSIEFRGGKRIGHNTDVTGFGENFRQGLPGAALDKALQIGCGGAGAATAHALLGDIGVGHLILSDNDPAKLGKLVEDLQSCYGAGRVSISDDLLNSAAQADGVVNATPVGMEKYPGLPLPESAIVARHWVADIVYFPLVTALLETAAAKGARTLDGSGMVINQAAEAFEIFTHRTTDRKRMAASFSAYQPVEPVAS
jgi:shikimate dehydrogenase